MIRAARQTDRRRESLARERHRQPKPLASPRRGPHEPHGGRPVGL